MGMLSAIVGFITAILLIFGMMLLAWAFVEYILGPLDDWLHRKWPALSWFLSSLLHEYWLIILVFSAVFLGIWLAHFLLPSGLSK
jgi:hypothetical protein